MTRYWDNAIFSSPHGTVRMDFDIEVDDGVYEAVKSSGHVPSIHDRVRVRAEHQVVENGKPASYAFLFQDGNIQALKNGTPRFLDPCSDEGLDLYFDRMPKLKAAIETYCNDGQRKPDLHEGLLGVLKYGMDVEPYGRISNAHAGDRAA